MIQGVSCNDANLKPYWSRVMYRREDDCQREGIPFRSKIDISCDFVATFQAPLGTIRVIHLVDAWYMNRRLIDRE